MSKAACLAHINDAISLLNDMVEILEETSSDAPQAFLEAAHDVQYQVNMAVSEALIPALKQAVPRLEDE